MHSQRNRKGPKLLITDDTKRPTFKMRRDEKGSQSEVAVKIKVSKDSLRGAENGFLCPSLYVAIKYCLFLECTLEELFPDLFVQARNELISLNV